MVIVTPILNIDEFGLLFIPCYGLSAHTHLCLGSTLDSVFRNHS